METIDYTPPPTVREFIKFHLPGKLFYAWAVGPIGSGKTTGNFMKLVHMAGLQERGPDGVRRTRCVVVRNTRPQLKDTTIRSWFEWFKPDIAGTWHATDSDFTLRFGDVVCEVMFRPLDTPQDVARVLSLEVTFAIIDEFIEIPKEIIDALSGRVGRYPARKAGGATNFGMWGASNPGTEDNWWFDYLHNKNEFEIGSADTANVEEIRCYGPYKEKGLALCKRPPEIGNVRYFHQPPGDSLDAENTANLPVNYYEDRMKGKTPAWIEQFVRAVWGFSASETPVIKSFRPNDHVARKGVLYSPYYKLVVGIDPGLGGMAAVFGQEDLYGRLLICGEVSAVGMGATRFCKELLRPYIWRYFQDADLVFALDPAANNKQPTDESTVKSAIEAVFGKGSCSIETNNRLAMRLDAIESFTMRSTEHGPALQIDAERAPYLIRALAGGWRYQKINKLDTNRPEPDKNSYSHTGDAFGYLCRFFHKRWERTGSRGMSIAEQHDRMRQFARQADMPSYHFT